MEVWDLLPVGLPGWGAELEVASRLVEGIAPGMFIDGRRARSAGRSEGPRLRRVVRSGLDIVYEV